MSSYLEIIFSSLKEYELLLAILFFCVYWLLKRTTEKTIKALAEKKTVHATRTAFINRCFNITYFSFLFAVYIIVSGIGYGNFSIFISSVFTVIGVDSLLNGRYSATSLQAFLFSLYFRTGLEIRSLWRMGMV